MIRIFLLSCGGSVAVTNAVIYIWLRDILKHHGYVQLFLCCAGVVMITVGMTIRRKAA